MVTYTQKHIDLAKAMQRHIRLRKGETTAVEALAEMLVGFEIATIGACACIAKTTFEHNRNAAVGLLMKIDSGDRDPETLKWKEFFIHRSAVADRIANAIADLIGPATGVVKSEVPQP